MYNTNPKSINKLDLEKFEKGTINHVWLHIINNGLGEPVRIPICVARGKKDGPVLGLTSSLHGNELNGIPVIQKMMKSIDVDELSGTVVGVLVANVPGYLLEQRKFNDDVDLNRIAPGKPNGTQSDLYINRFIERIASKFNFHIDLHTASVGRVNSYYIRADMSDPITSKLARLQNPDIILHNPPNDKTLRGNIQGRGIPSITLELKDPNLFQYDVIEDSLIGIHNVLYFLKMVDGEVLCPVKNTILCETSSWYYTDEGGILSVKPELKQKVKKGELIAETQNIFGKVIKQYFAPEDGIIIGKSVNPVNQSGSRIVHLGQKLSEIPCITEDDTTYIQNMK
ncbi:succinylglutamate desuccinylase/aspartoacylase family protein [Aureivirga sp. CE67]|uniref:succinylglutamate desuccinylase/aspartoacylase family protein n=1 Tax=Aureivirga sp. CE67 TaxID=1788983 RepID=UPI0018CBC7BD|nr:succinylglutamate desuccinylase/aspartoacylase family protein [Aureivirga sp. CE67]